MSANRRKRGRLGAVPDVDVVALLTGQRLGEEADTSLVVGDARPGFHDALCALTPDGRVYAGRLEELVLGPFVHDVCLRAVERAPAVAPEAWEELADDLGDVPLVEVAAEGLPRSVVRARRGCSPCRSPACSTGP